VSITDNSKSLYECLRCHCTSPRCYCCCCCCWCTSPKPFMSDLTVITAFCVVAFLAFCRASSGRQTDDNTMLLRTKSTRGKDHTQTLENSRLPPKTDFSPDNQSLDHKPLFPSHTQTHSQPALAVIIISVIIIVCVTSALLCSTKPMTSSILLLLNARYD